MRNNKMYAMYQRYNTLANREGKANAKEAVMIDRELNKLGAIMDTFA